jgi:hypothetical protein
MSTPKESAHLTTGDVARSCGVAPRTVSLWTDSGKLASFRLPGSLDRRILPSDLIRFLASEGWPLPLGAPNLVRSVLTVGIDCGLLAALAASMPVESGYAFEAVDTPFDAGVAASILFPRCVVVDASIGRIDAVQIAVGLRSPRFTRKMPVILLGLPDDRFTEGFSVILQKPVDHEELVRRIRSLTTIDPKGTGIRQQSGRRWVKQAEGSVA